MNDVHASTYEQLLRRKKLPKDEVSYTDQSTKEEKCADCQHFEKLEARHCSKVQGIISPTGWCVKWAAK
jgi:high potential iron-sulfur protein